MEDKAQYLMFYGMASHHVETTFKRLWRTKVWDYRPFYGFLGPTVLADLLVITEWSQRTRWMLRFPYASCVVLFFIAPLLRMLKCIYHGRK